MPPFTQHLQASADSVSCPPALSHPQAVCPASGTPCVQLLPPLTPPTAAAAVFRPPGFPSAPPHGSPCSPGSETRALISPLPPHQATSRVPPCLLSQDKSFWLSLQGLYDFETHLDLAFVSLGYYHKVPHTGGGGGGLKHRK